MDAYVCRCIIYVIYIEGEFDYIMVQLLTWRPIAFVGEYWIAWSFTIDGQG